MPSDRVDALLKRIEKFNPELMILEICKRLEKEIIKLNTDRQLYFRGIGGDGQKLKPYAPSTVKKKVRDNLPTWTTLFQSGKFHHSWRIEVRGDEIWFWAGENEVGRGFSLRDHLVKVYGKDIFGLTEENLTTLKGIILQEYEKQKNGII